MPLSAAGEAHLQALISRLPSQAVPDALFTSPLRRAREVAAALGRGWALEPYAAEWAREIHCGDVEGMPLQQLQREFAVYWTRNEAQADETFAWPGGETYGEFRARILEGLRATAAAHAGQRVAVVTHAGVVSQALGVIRGRAASVWEPDRPNPLTATEITWSNGGLNAVLTFNNPDWY